MKKLLVILMGLAACTSKPSTPDWSSMDQYMNSLFPADGPGGAVLIARGDSVLFSAGYGLADLVTKEKITTGTLFNVGSISKTFVANAILQLQEQGKLSVDDSLIRYFPNFRNKQIGRSVRIRHLLTHTSGLPDIRPVRRDSVFYLTAKDAENWAPILEADSLVFEAGSAYDYSNPAFNALALIIEQVTGQKWQDYVREQIFAPCNMTTSTITDGPHPQSGVSHAYIKVKGSWSEKDYGEEPTFAAAGNGGVWSSVVELMKYERGLKQAAFLKAETIQDARTVKTFSNWTATTPPFIGWSWFVGKTPDGLETVGHTGSQGGFRANYVTVPAVDVQIVILCNAPYDLQPVTDHVLEQLKSAPWWDTTVQP